MQKTEIFDSYNAFYKKSAIQNHEISDILNNMNQHRQSITKNIKMHPCPIWTNVKLLRRN